MSGNVSEKVKQRNITTAKEKIPSKFRIGETCFTFIAVIGGKLFSNHPQNMNHVHKDTMDLLSVILTLGNNIYIYIYIYIYVYIYIYIHIYK